MWAELVYLFTTISWEAATCLLVGLAFVIIEMFLPGFGIFGAVGGILIVVGTIIHIATTTSSNPVAQFFLLLGILLILLTGAFLLMVRSAKKGFLSRTPLFDKTPAVPTGITEGTPDYTQLVGKIGVAKTALRPSGVVTIEEKNYDVVAAGFFIAAGEIVKVASVEGNKVVVTLMQ